MKIILVIILFFGFVNFCFAGSGYLSDEQQFKDFLVPSTAIVIGTQDKELGRLEWKTGKLIFTGDAEESAKVFFNEFLKPMVDQYIEEN